LFSTLGIFQKDTLQQLVKILGSIQAKDLFLRLVSNAEDRSRDLAETPTWLSLPPRHGHQLHHATPSTEPAGSRQSDELLAK